QFFVTGFLLLAVMCFGQNRSGLAKLKRGDKITEGFAYCTDNGSTAKYDIPNGAYTLLYRFGDKNGSKDNYDTLAKVISHVYRLSKYFGPKRKQSKLTCYIYVKEVNEEARTLKNKIKSWNKTICDSIVNTNMFGNFIRTWEILFVPDSAVARPGSALATDKL